MVAASNVDGTAIVPVVVASIHALGVSDGTTGTDNGRPAAARDENFVPVLMAVSSVDGVTPVEVYADAAIGYILINSH